MTRSGGPQRPLMATAILGLAAWQAAFIGTPPAGSGRGHWKTRARSASRVPAAAVGDGSEPVAKQRRVWLKDASNDRLYDVWVEQDVIGVDLRRAATPDFNDRERALVTLWKADGAELNLEEPVPDDVGDTGKSAVKVEVLRPRSDAGVLEAPLRKGGTGSGSFLWVQVKGGEPVEYPTEDLRNVGGLLKAVYIEVQRRLPAGVGVDQLKLYASEEAYKKNEALRVTNQSMTELKDTAKRLGIEPTGDRRTRADWANALQDHLQQLAFEVDEKVNVIVEAGSGKTAQEPLYVDYPEPGGSGISKAAASSSGGQPTAVPDLEPCVVRVQELLSSRPVTPTSLEDACQSGDWKHMDFSFRIALHGRLAFFHRIRDLLRSLQESPPELSQHTRSVVYSTVSGAGKTRAMLSLEGQLRKLDVDNLLVVYIGFNCGAQLLSSEEGPCTSKDGALKVLYRRLIVAVLSTLHVQDRAHEFPQLAEEREVGAIMPVDVEPLLCEIPLEACGQSAARGLLRRILQERGIQRFVVCVDEVQRLDGFHVQEPRCGLGRFFLRELRSLQLAWRRLAITVLPLGTGITPDFVEVPTEGQHLLLDKREELLVDLVAYKEILTEQLRVVGETGLNSAARDTIARMLWPVVRVLEPSLLKDALGELKLKRHPSREEALVVLDSTLFNLPIDKGDFPSDIVPFLAVDEVRVTAVPHALCAGPLAAVLAENLPTVYSWLSRLPRVKGSLRDMAASVLKYSDFQTTSFVVLGAYLGLLLVRRPPSNFEHSPQQSLIRDVQPFVNQALELRDCSPVLVPLALYYPFKDEKRAELHSHFVDTVSEMKPNSAAAFDAGHGTNAKADFWYVIRGADADKKRRFHVLVGDFKHTIESHGTVAVSDAEQVLAAKQSLLDLWRGKWQNDVVTTTPFVICAATTTQSRWPNEVSLLNAASLEFLPWTLFLFREISVE